MRCPSTTRLSSRQIPNRDRSSHSSLFTSSRRPSLGFIVALQTCRATGCVVSPDTRRERPFDCLARRAPAGRFGRKLLNRCELAVARSWWVGSLADAPVPDRDNLLTVPAFDPMNVGEIAKLGLC